MIPLEDLQFHKDGLTKCAPAQVYLIDLEWAGEVGKAKYPIFMNRTDIEWPPGASDNQPITLEHDVHWMNALLSE